MGSNAPEIIELATVGRTLAAPRSAVWSLVSDFAHPERIVPGLASPVLIGDGVGMIRLVRVGDRTMRERLLAWDEPAGTLTYEIEPSGDMPLAGLRWLTATVSVRPVASEQTSLRWLVEGVVDGDPSTVRATLASMYAAGLDRIGALLAGSTKSADSQAES